MARLWTVQACGDRQGWFDIPGEVYKKEHEAIRASEEIAGGRPVGEYLQNYSRHALRTLRKPKGWKP